MDMLGSSLWDVWNSVGQAIFVMRSGTNRSKIA